MLPKTCMGLSVLVSIEAGEHTPVQIDEALVQRLASYSWPGNLRQLRNVLCTMLALRESDYLTLEDFDESWLTNGGGGSRTATEPEVRTAADEEDCNVLSSAECEALRRTLEACNWNVSAVAVRLNLSRKTVYRKMHRHGLVRPELGRIIAHADADEAQAAAMEAASNNRFHDGTPAVISDRR